MATITICVSEYMVLGAVFVLIAVQMAIAVGNLFRVLDEIGKDRKTRQAEIGKCEDSKQGRHPRWLVQPMSTDEERQAEAGPNNALHFNTVYKKCI